MTEASSKAIVSDRCIAVYPLQMRFSVIYSILPYLWDGMESTKALQHTFTLRKPLQKVTALENWPDRGFRHCPILLAYSQDTVALIS